MPFWSGEKLRAIGRARGATLIVPFNENQIDCNAYRLRMGSQYYVTGDPSEVAGTGGRSRKKLRDRDAFAIPPGQFALLLSKETVTIPRDAMAFISIRTSIKFRGLINISGFHVDPGYSGKLIFAVFNASPSPIHIPEDSPIFRIWFCEMDRESNTPFIYHDAGITEITDEMTSGLGAEVYSLQSLARKYAEQKPAIEHLTSMWNLITLTITGGLIVAVFVTLFALVWPSIAKLAADGANRIAAQSSPTIPVQSGVSSAK